MLSLGACAWLFCPFGRAMGFCNGFLRRAGSAEDPSKGQGLVWDINCSAPVGWSLGSLQGWHCDGPDPAACCSPSSPCGDWRLPLHFARGCLYRPRPQRATLSRRSLGLTCRGLAALPASGQSRRAAAKGLHRVNCLKPSVFTLEKAQGSAFLTRNPGRGRQPGRVCPNLLP